MGTFFVRHTNNTWRGTGVPFVRTSSGWKRSKYAFVRVGSSWVQFWQQDTTPPPKPTVTITAGSGASFSVRVRASGGPFSRIIVKLTTGSTWPTNPTDSLGWLNNPTNWSEWSNGHSSATYDVTKTVSASYSTKYNISVWACDDYFNWSPVGTATYTTPNPAPPPPVLKDFTATINPGSSQTWHGRLQIWPSDTGNYVIQAGENNYVGCWFYGTTIASALAGSNSVTSARARVVRLNTAHGVSGGAIVHMGTHGLTGRPSGSPGNMANRTAMITLNRGEAGWANLHAVWSSSLLQNFRTGGWRGIGLHYGTTSWSSQYYLRAYGAGTESGRLSISYNKYV